MLFNVTNIEVPAEDNAFKLMGSRYVKYSLLERRYTKF